MCEKAMTFNSVVMSTNVTKRLTHCTFHSLANTERMTSVLYTPSQTFIDDVLTHTGLNNIVCYQVTGHYISTTPLQGVAGQSTVYLLNPNATLETSAIGDPTLVNNNTTPLLTGNDSAIMADAGIIFGTSNVGVVYLDIFGDQLEGFRLGGSPSGMVVIFSPRTTIQPVGYPGNANVGNQSSNGWSTGTIVLVTIVALLIFAASLYGCSLGYKKFQSSRIANASSAGSSSPSIASVTQSPVDSVNVGTSTSISPVDASQPRYSFSYSE